MLKNKSGSFISGSGRQIVPNRPEPIISDIDVVPYKSRIDPKFAIDDLVAGYNVLIVDFYSSGLKVLRALKKYLNKQYPDQSFQGQRKFRSAYRELSHRLLFEINNHKLSVKKAPEIDWLKILYPELDFFLLPVPQVQGLNSSWQWYQKGISVPVINRKIHPWFGTYFPTRFEHLLLFDNWLKRYSGEKKSALDIGVGSGILTLQLLQQGFKKVYATDSNPNAILGFKEDIDKNELNSKVELYYGDLFSGCNIKTDLIVFNPPWLPASYDTEGIDKAIYYEQDLFSRFFKEAKKHLNPKGRIVLLFSNLANISGLSETHPILQEIEDGGRFQKELLVQKKLGRASDKTKRNSFLRASEMVELWVLKNY